MSDKPTFSKFVENHDLFQDYYLLQYVAPTLPLTPEEAQDDKLLRAARADAANAQSKITALWQARKKQLPVSEANVEDFVAEVCRILGMIPSSQGSVPRDGTTTQRVDLVLFADNDATNRFAEYTKQQKPAVERYAEALAVVEVERVRKNFNPKKSSRDSPQQQIVNYLTYTGVPWGILTDGERWRIYRRFDPPRFGAWLEINLSEILYRTDPVIVEEAFWCFVGFFHRDAFDRQQRTARLDAFYEGSVQYAVGVQDSLRDQAFKVVEALAQGMYATHTAPDTVNLDTLYDQAIVILYRLLFLKFAEDQHILPIRHPVYRLDYGYAQIEQTVLERLDDTNYPLGESQQSTRFWNSLMYLFKDVNKGNTDAHIFAYNGGLFRPERLDDVIIPDAFLAQALDHLSRITQNGNGEKLRISYRDLEIRHLGSIYEGLLEQHLERLNGTVQMVSSSGQPTNQRRSSGSYYTPDYIVDYIVQQTIDPLCEGKTTEEIASLTILDPSMGSGHFLVTAHTRLAWHHAMARNRATTPPPERIATEPDALFAERMNAYHAHITPTDEEVAQSTYELVERCIYGVDLNPLAVELTKLALWLSTLTRERPLSFLDHHLTTGNSLIGARLDDLESLNGNGTNPNGSARQLGLFEQAFGRVRDQLLASFQRIAALPTNTAQDVLQKEQEYATFRDFSKPFRMVANLWVSRHVGNNFNGDQYQETLEALNSYYADPPDATQWDALQQQPWFVYAEEQATKRLFFHWELEFPEVFLREQSGFDVVIGNPPYGLVHILPGYDGFHNDAFVYFWKVCIEKSRSGGVLSLITPASWLTGINYQSIREMMLERTKIQAIVTLPYNIFVDAYIDTCIAVLHNGQPTQHLVRTKQMGKYDDAQQLAMMDWHEIESELWHQDRHKKFTLNPTIVKLQRFRVLSAYCTLGDLILVERGVQPYSRSKHTSVQIKNDFLRVHGQPPSYQGDEYYPELLGEELSRHYINPSKQTWLQFSDALASRRHADFFTKPRVVLRRLLSRRRELMAAMTSEKLITTDNILNMLIKVNDYHEGYISSLLNAKLLAWMYTSNSAISVKDDFPQVTYEELKQLPIRRIHFSTPQDKREQLVHDIIAQAEGMTKPNAPIQSVCDVAAFRASDLGQALVALLPIDEHGQFIAFKDDATGNEEHSDIVHDLLAHLAQRMMHLNRERRQHITNLLTDLEGVMHASDWSNLGKTRQLWNPKTKKAQATSDAAKMLGDLHNKTLSIDDDIGRISRTQFPWLLKHKLGQVKNMADVLTIYDQYHAQITTIEHQRDATDHLIDQIVYLLYGLTPDEVALIEASGC